MNSTSVALLTGGSDKPYALGLSSALAAQGISVDFVGSDELDCPEVRNIPGVRFLNLRGDQNEAAAPVAKVSRVLRYYWRILSYVATTPVPTLHILWNNKFEWLDRTALMAYYRAAGKRVVMTAHNVNTAARNGTDTWLNRITLRIQYRLCDHIFVHTAAMKQELISHFGVPADRIGMIPFGINDTIPKSALTSAAARERFGISPDEQVLLFFGQIAPYKGLEFLVEAVKRLAESGRHIRLIIAGKVKRGSEHYWRDIQQSVVDSSISHSVIAHARFIPDEEVEPYLKAADAVVVPYLDIYQSGVPFLAFSFGLPVIATDVGSLREDVTPETGVLCQPRDAADLGRAIETFFDSPLYREAGRTRAVVRRFADEKHSWRTVAALTHAVYTRALASRGIAFGVSETSREPQNPI